MCVQPHPGCTLCPTASDIGMTIIKPHSCFLEQNQLKIRDALIECMHSQICYYNNQLFECLLQTNYIYNFSSLHIQLLLYNHNQYTFCVLKKVYQLWLTRRSKITMNDKSSQNFFFNSKETHSHLLKLLTFISLQMHPSSKEEWLSIYHNFDDSPNIALLPLVFEIIEAVHQI